MFKVSKYFEKSKRFYLIIGLIMAFILTLALTYSVFMVSTNSSRASEMYISRLTYDITLTDEEGFLSGINKLVVTLNSYEEKLIKIKVKSLNLIKSKYKLQYKTQGDVEVFYTDNTPFYPEEDIGIINQVESEKTIHLYLINNKIATTTVEFGVSGGYIHNEFSQISLIADYVEIIDEYIPFKTTVYEYTGESQEVILKRGRYKIELWGARGGNISPYNGGKGAYVSGEINIQTKTAFYLYIGSHGSDTNDSGGYNGGGNITSGQKAYGRGGGGSSDLRYFASTPTSEDLMWDSVLGLRSRIIVAGGGGGSNFRSSDYGEGMGGDAGGLTGISGQTINGTNGYGYSLGSGGSQIEGGYIIPTPLSGFPVTQNAITGDFGKGGGIDTFYLMNVQSGGGSGYYGGGFAGHGGGGGGSSYISGHTGCVAIVSENNQNSKSECNTGTSDNNCSIHYSNLKFINTIMIDGSGYKWTNIRSNQVQMPKYDDTLYPLGNGNDGNGYAKITFLGI